MNLFAISDLHLSFGTDKPMDVFRGWKDYTERISKNWKSVVTDDDYVVIAGDISWANKLSEAVEDFNFINLLPGKKIILKGNHDFWWQTVTKINEFFFENHFDSITVIHNNCVIFGDYAVCGTRGWLYDSTASEDEKIVARECGRLETSLQEAEKAGKKPIVFLHYPPVYGGFVSEEIFAILKNHKIKDVYYGHIHGSGSVNCLKEYNGIKMHLISCDFLGFSPILVKKSK